MTVAPGTITIRPVLFCAPVFWVSDYWAPSAHDWDWVKAETPLDDKPWAEIEVSLDVTVAEVFAVACDAWGIKPGPGMLKQGATREGEFYRFAFVRPERDAAGVDEQEGYQWPSTLPIAREDGSIRQIRALEITYRELLASSALGLLEGDVKRPYVHPVMPQGDTGAMIEIGKYAVEAIRAVYREVDGDVGPAAQHTIRLLAKYGPKAYRVKNEVADEGMRDAWWIAALVFLRRAGRKLRTK